MSPNVNFCEMICLLAGNQLLVGDKAAGWKCSIHRRVSLQGRRTQQDSHWRIPWRKVSEAGSEQTAVEGRQ